MFELWPISLLFLLFAFILYIILRDAQETGSIFVHIFIPKISKKEHPEYYKLHYYGKYIGITLCIIFAIIFLAIDIPDSSNPINNSGPKYTSAEFKEILNGTWSGDSPFVEGILSITFYENEECEGRYSGVNYTGTWSDGLDINNFNEVNFNWNNPLKVPSTIEGQYHTVNSASYQYGSLHTTVAFSLDKNQ